MQENFGSLTKNNCKMGIWRWFKNAVKRFEVANVGHVITRVKSIDNSGLVAVSQARSYVEPILKIKKKG
jgi:peptidyl-prolyl cis-trans isomerase D